MRSKKRKSEEVLKLYLITPRVQPEDEDCWGDAVVAAHDIHGAKETHPCAEDAAEWDDDAETWGCVDYDAEWVPPYEVLAEEIGTALDHVEPGVVIARWSMGE